ncbi:MAG: hypothetical protein L6V93_10100 [Clostridiales bacterium]|nr:MAG: hypothetical protein L6V93_10100 [Clostridiales bacterium]
MTGTIWCRRFFQTHAYATNSILNPMYDYGMVYTNEFDLDNTAGYAKDAGLTDRDKNGVYEKTVDDEVFSLSFSVLADADDDKNYEKLPIFLCKMPRKRKISLSIKRLSGEEYQTVFAEKDYDILLTKEKISCGDNLASKLDFNGKYEVPYEIYTELANVFERRRHLKRKRKKCASSTIYTFLLRRALRFATIHMQL